ncbi:type II secretion system F family protein [Granulicella arctica]|uniref:type II secretion system F family protein n=1 Tax=Granulicella arctica TaxID=940613 RepID=UPI0021E0E65E|nr:type II secretion system F family protein [Granulicella arctica]
MQILFTLSLVSGVLAGSCFFASLVISSSSDTTMQRLYMATNAKTRKHTGISATGPYVQVFLRVMLWVRTSLRLRERADLERRIERAGYRGVVTLDLYAAIRLIAPLVAVVLALLLPKYCLFGMFALPPFAYIVPDLILELLIRRRAKAIRGSIPDAIDLLVICVDAGLGIDQAVMRVAQELTQSSPELQEELMQVNREQRAGKPRLEAWCGMSERLSIPEIEAFVNMLMQTERFGTPIARALSTFADGIRLKRTQIAEESAAKTTVKIIFPLALFIFPCIFIVLLGPAVITMLQDFPEGF